MSCTCSYKKQSADNVKHVCFTSLCCIWPHAALAFHVGNHACVHTPSVDQVSFTVLPGQESVPNIENRIWIIHCFEYFGNIASVQFNCSHGATLIVMSRCQQQGQDDVQFAEFSNLLQHGQQQALSLSGEGHQEY